VGIHATLWHEFESVFGFNAYRLELLGGLLQAATSLAQSGCHTIYVGGSFVTDKEFPADYDGCWDTKDVDKAKLDPVLLDIRDLSNGRSCQKLKYRGELFPGTEGWLDFLQSDRDGVQKGVVAIDLRSLPK